MPAGQALQKAGMTLVMKVGGASGPLYGSLLMGMGKSLAPSQATEEPGSDEPGPLDLADALQAGVGHGPAARQVRRRREDDARRPRAGVRGAS